MNAHAIWKIHWKKLKGWTKKLRKRKIKQQYNNIIYQNLFLKKREKQLKKTDCTNIENQKKTKNHNNTQYFWKIYGDFK